MLCNTDKAHNAELEYLDMLNRHIVDGVITGVHSLDVEEYKKDKKKNQSLHLTVIWEKIFLWLQSIISTDGMEDAFNDGKSTVWTSISK